jgi:hypothetical protein
VIFSACGKKGLFLTDKSFWTRIIRMTRIFLIFESGDVDGQTNFPKKGENRKK